MSDEKLEQAGGGGGGGAESVLHCINRQALEITRLKAEVEKLKNWIKHWEGRTLKAEAEVERKDAALGKAVAWADRHGKEPDWLDEARAGTEYAAAISSLSRTGED